jgi:hypothetical protein
MDTRQTVNATTFALVAALLLQCTGLSAQATPEPPPAPEGFDFKSVGESVPEMVEGMRVDLIRHALRDCGLDMRKRLKVAPAFRQQIHRMLRMDEATRNAALRLGVFTLGSEPDLDLDEGFFDAFTAFAAEVEKAELKRKVFDGRLVGLGEPDFSLVQPMEFALLYFHVFKGRKIKLDDPAKGIAAMLARTDAKVRARDFLKDCAAFATGQATVRPVQHYIGYCMALVPGATPWLKGVAAYFRGGADAGERYLKEDAAYFEECALMSQIVAENPDISRDELFARALAAGTSKAVLGVSKAISSNWRAAGENMSLYQRVVELLKSKPNLSEEERKRLKEYEILVSPARNEGIGAPDTRETKNVGGNVFFGF